MHSTIPTAVGSAMEKSIHRVLPVSRRIVRQVVAQGQWNRKNTAVQSAISQLKPANSNAEANSVPPASSWNVPVTAQHHNGQYNFVGR